MSEEAPITNAAEAALEFKNTIIDLVEGLSGIVAEYEKKKGVKSSDFASVFKNVVSGVSIEKVFDEGLSPSQKLLIAYSYAKTMDADVSIRKFIKNTEAFWPRLLKEDQKVMLEGVNVLDIPKSGALALKDIFEKKTLLTDNDRAGVMSYIKTCVEYASIYKSFS